MIARILLLLSLVLAPLSLMAASSEGEPLVIATRHAPPFAIRTDSGWSGITIELVQRIAKEQGLDYRLEAMGLTEMLDAVARGEVAAAAAALTVTADREQRVDFTHPFFTSGLGIAVAARGELTWISALGRVASGPFLQSLGALLGLLTLLGVLVWLAERRHNAQFPEGPGKGIGSGLWWSAVTMTTVGYGDKAPITLAGRLIALVWMFTSIIVISGFTAAITSSLTVGELDHSVSGLEDLYGMRVVTTRGSTSASFLTEKLIRHRTTEDAAEALEELAAGRADAVVYDVPILRYLVREHHPGEIRVLPYLLTRQDYGIALPEGTVLREELNRRILRIIRSPEWERMVEGYLGRGSE